MSQTLTTFICASLEQSINTALKYDPGTRYKLAKLENKQLALVCTQPTLRLYIYITQNTLYINSETHHDSDVTLTGDLLDLLKLVINGDRSLADSGVEVAGKIGVLTELQDTFSDLDIDWEEPIVDILGSTAGHTLAQGIRTVAGWANDAGKNTLQNLPELLTEELRLIPSKYELEDFYESVDQIRTDTSRTSAKIQALKNLINEKQNH